MCGGRAAVKLTATRAETDGGVMNRSLKRRWALALAAAVLSVSACGGGGDAPTVAEDKATSERIVLTSADLPGFTMEPDEPDDDSSGSFKECVKDNPLLTGNNKPRSTDGAGFTRD